MNNVQQRIVGTISTTPLSASACPKCGGHYELAGGDEAACINCGYRINVVEAEEDGELETVGAALGADFEPYAVESMPAVANGRSRYYDQLAQILIRLGSGKEGLRFRMTKTNTSLCGAGSGLKNALDRIGRQDLSVSVRDVGGYRYLQLIPRRVQAKPRKLKPA